MNLYRVAYVYRSAPDAMPQEKVCFVAAEDHNDAVKLVNADPGNEVVSANVHVPKIRLVQPAQKERRNAPNIEVPSLQQEV
jgi:hypothetical protein